MKRTDLQRHVIKIVRSRLRETGIEVLDLRRLPEDDLIHNHVGEVVNDIVDDSIRRATAARRSIDASSVECLDR